MNGTLTLGRQLATGSPHPVGRVAGLVLMGIGGIGMLMTGDDADNADRAADEDMAGADTAEACPTCPCQRTVVVSSAMSPVTAQHMLDAQAAGHPNVLTLDRPGAPARRRAALRGYPIRPGWDRDEYPPAVFAEGGAGSSVRYIRPGDNRSAGTQIRNQIAGVPDGCEITLVVGP